MSKRNRLPIFLLLLVFTGCSALPTPALAPTPNGEIMIQKAMKTAAAIITASANAPAAPAPTATQPPAATAAPTEAASPTLAALPQVPTPGPTVKSVSYPGCDIAGFIDDVTIPDDTVIPGGTAFTKTWKLRNTGGCAWDSSYQLVFYDGTIMGGPKTQQLTTGTVAPGQTVEVSVNLTAPQTRGTFTGYWRLRNAAGKDFGLGKKGTAIYVKIVVKSLASFTATPAATATVKP